MTKLSSLTKAFILVGITVLCSIISMLVTELNISAEIAMALDITAMVGGLLSLVYLWKSRGQIAYAIKVCQRLEKGEFDARFENITEGGDLGALFWGINDLTDRVDAYIRESSAVTEHLSEGKYYRRILEEGMGGIMLNAARMINKAVDSFKISMGKNHELISLLKSLDQSQAVIEFNTDGTIITANPNFLQTLGYDLNEIKGQHHRMFVDPAYANSSDYQQFWRELGEGKTQVSEYRRFGKGGKEIYISASYNPVPDVNGKIFKVVKFAIDITEKKLTENDYAGQLKSLDKSQAVIEFNMDGTITKANPNFLTVMGYTMDEIRGHHHSMFADEVYRSSPEYKEFWDKLNRGEAQFGEFKRINKKGEAVYIQASYNPIPDMNGKPFKVVKFAVDVTAHKLAEFARMEAEQREQREKEARSQRVAQLIAEFDTNATRTVSTVASASTELSQTAEHMSQLAMDANRQSTEVASASQQASQNVQSVASAAEEMAATVQEISRQVSLSNTMVREAMQKAESADASSRELVEMSRAVGAIADLIENIAGQINLLALNATIESARSGEAGKGFAVVANEVKNLATQTAKATEQIRQQLDGVQKTAVDVADILGSVKESIGKVSESSTTIAAAVEEQSAATHEIVSNMSTATLGVEQINQGIFSIKGGTETTSASTNQVLSAAKMLSEQAEKMDSQVKSFLQQIQTA